MFIIFKALINNAILLVFTNLSWRTFRITTQQPRKQNKTRKTSNIKILTTWGGCWCIPALLTIFVIHARKTLPPDVPLLCVTSSERFFLLLLCFVWPAYLKQLKSWFPYVDLGFIILLLLNKCIPHLFVDYLLGLLVNWGWKLHLFCSLFYPQSLRQECDTK